MFGAFFNQDEDALSQRKAFEESCPKGLQANPDRIAKTFGPLGSKLNPITVNGLQGSLNYLQRLMTYKSSPLLFHRMGSGVICGLPTPLDQYEYVSLDGKQWGVIWLSPYHLKRTTKSPDNLFLKPWRDCDEFERIGINTKQRGSNDYLENFPHSLPEHLRAYLSRNFAGEPAKGWKHLQLMEEQVAKIPLPNDRLSDLHREILKQVDTLKTIWGVSDDKANAFEAAAIRAYNFLGVPVEPYFQEYWTLARDITKVLPFDIQDKSHVLRFATLLTKARTALAQTGDFDVAFPKAICEMAGCRIPEAHEIARVIRAARVAKVARN